MAKLELRPDEYVVIRSREVRHAATKGMFMDHLVLTNKHVILISRSVLGSIRGTHYLPIDTIKHLDGRAHVVASGNDLEIYFVDRHELFAFRNVQAPRVWAEQLFSLLTGGLPGPMSPFGTPVLGIEYGAPPPSRPTGAPLRPPPEHASVGCQSCGASITGAVGQVVRCLFCNSSQRL